MFQAMNLTQPWRETISVATRTAVLLLTGLLAALSTLLFARRLSGAFDQALSGGALLVVGLLAVLGVSACRGGVWACYGVRHPGVRWGMIALPAVCLLLLGSALTLPSSPLWATALLWVLFGASETAWGTRLFRDPGVPFVTRTATTESLQQEERLSPVDVEPPVVEDHEPQVEGMLQQWTRALQDTGEESLHGILRERFEPGERLRQVHVAICPPLEQVPRVDVFQSDGPSANVKVAQRETFGLRFEVRLSTVATEVSWVELEFFAQALRGSPETE